MKKLKLIYNPYSGDRSFPSFLDECVTSFQNAGYETHIFKSMEKGDIPDHIGQMQKNYYDAMVISGGDGTINIVLNALLQHGHDIPIGIIPSGTANDFASHLKIPKDVGQAIEVISRGRIIQADIGLVKGVGAAEEKYFINVCGAGLLTNISQNIDEDFKNLLGKLAYYIKGIGQLPNFVPLNVRVTNSQESFETEVYLMIVLNSSGTGGFENLSPNASIIDGKLDFIGIKSMPIIDLAKLFVKIFAGDLLDDPNIIFFQDEYIKIEPLFEHKTFLETDIDGESGPDMPVEIWNISKKIRLFL